MSYREEIEINEFPTLDDRGKRRHMVTSFKFFHGPDNVNVMQFFKISDRTINKRAYKTNKHEMSWKRCEEITLY